MERLNEALQNLCRESGSTNTALARYAQIDRPTLVHILAGRRLPTPPALERLLLALQATPEQRRQILALYEDEKTDPVTRRQRACILEMLRQIFHTREGFESPYPEATSGTFVPRETVSHLNGERQIIWTLGSMLRRYCADAGTEPLMIPPGLGEKWLRALANLLVGLPGSGTIWQLSTFAKRSVGGDATVYNLKHLSMAVPFAHLENIRYEICFSYTQAYERVPGALLCAYLLFPDALFIISQSDRLATIIRDPEMVDNCRKQFTKDFRQAHSYLSVAAQEKNGARSIITCSSEIDRQQRPTWLLRREPSLLTTVDEEIVRDYVVLPEEEREELMQLIHGRLAEIAMTDLTCFCVEDGIREFAQTGRIREVPESIYRPLEPAVRYRMLDRLIRLSESGRHPIYLLNAPDLVPPPETYFTAAEGVGIYFYLYCGNEGFKILRFTEQGTNEAFCDFFRSLPNSSYCMSKEESLTILRRWRDTLPKA